MQFNLNPIEFEFVSREAVGEMGTKPVCRKRCSVMSTKVESGRREASSQFFPATKPGWSPTTKQPARNGQAGDNYGHWPRDSQVWQLWPGTSKYGQLWPGDRQDLLGQNEHGEQVFMGMEYATWKGLTSRVN